MGGMLPLPPRTGPLDYTGPDYREIGDWDDPTNADLPLSCGCWDMDSMEFGPDYPCAIDRRRDLITGLARFDEKLTTEQRVDGMTPCRIWNGTLAVNGYGVLGIDGRQVKAHRFAYEAIVGPIPEGLVIDHLCRVRCCVNPDHLEPVTNGENVLRGVSAPAQHARATHCLRGHEYTPDNTIKNGAAGRGCRTCKNDRKRSRTAANPAPRRQRGVNVTHGLGSTYRSYGCRCEPCTTANTEDGRAARRRRLEAEGITE
jgi:hypothetical protein